MNNCKRPAFAVKSDCVKERQMKMNWLSALIVLSILGNGLIAGVFFAFSSFLMNVFAGLPERQGVTAMQSINVTIEKSLFMLPFLFTALLSLVLIVLAFQNLGKTGSGFAILGGLLYLIGSFGVTMLFNVPLNNALAAENASLEVWRSYLATWTVWNHVRTVAGVLAMGALMLALLNP
jgi:uncharacterized membrane protein